MKTLLLISLVFPTWLLAQMQSPDYGPLFLQDEVARIDITLDEDSLERMYDDIDYGSTHEFAASFMYTSSEGVITQDEIGFRLRGNTSLQSDKKSFKVSFNTFINGNQVAGLEKLNLNGEHNDVSLMRAKIGWEMLREQGLPASRTSYVALHINGDYFGLYLNVEHIDEEFVKSRFSDKVGNLYKCLWPARLEYVGDNADAYKFTQSGRRVYDLKTNRGYDDYSRFAHFIDVLSNTAIADLPCALEPLFDVDSYLRIAAFDVLTGNWDGYAFGKNNFYIYEEPDSRRIKFMSYDLDNTLGIDFVNQTWTTRNIYNWSQGNRPLYDRLLQVPAYREQYSQYIHEWMDGPFAVDRVFNRIEELQELIGPFVEIDPYYPLDYGFDYDDFLASNISAWGNHIEQGVVSFVEQRRLQAQLQLEDFSPMPRITEMQLELLTTESHQLRVWTEGLYDELLLEVWEGDIVNTLTLLDDGLSGDGAANDGQYAALISAEATDALDIAIIMRQGGADIDRSPHCGFKRVWLSSTDGPIYINELMASNSSTVTDNAGEYDDWVELYNSTDAPYDMAALYLTDDLSCPDRFNIPYYAIGADDHRVIWLDDDAEQGFYHTDFKLSAAGEELALYALVDGSFRLMDYISFGQQITDVSLGRAIDGAAPWMLFDTPTPDAANSIINGLDDLASRDAPLIYWDASQAALIARIDAQLQLYDVLGKQVMAIKAMAGEVISTRALHQGVYFYRVLSKQGAMQTGKIHLN